MRALLRAINQTTAGRFRVQSQGFTLRAPTWDRLSYVLLHKAGLMGKSDREKYPHYIRPGMTVIDVGANIGIHALQFSRLVGPQGKVIAIEPDPDLFASLQDNLALNQVTNVQAVRSAAGAASGSAVLRRGLLNSGNNHLVEPSKATSTDPHVPIISLDELLGTQPVDFIKVDVQGYEPQVLAGMQRVVAANPSLTIVMEFWPRGLCQSGFDPNGLRTAMEDLGLEIRLWSSGRSPSDAEWTTLCQIRGYTNIIAKRRD